MTVFMIKKLKEKYGHDNSDINNFETEIKSLKMFATMLLTELCIENEKKSDQYISSMQGNGLLAQIDERGNINLMFAPLCLYESELVGIMKNLN